MADRTPFSLRVITPEGVLFDADAQIAIVNGVGGDIGMLANHAPLVADLRIGTCRVQDTEGEWHAWATAEGFATTSYSKAVVLVEEAIHVDEISVEAADQLIDEHRNRIASTEGKDEHDVYLSAVDASNKSIAWGEHLKRVHADQVSGS